MFSQIFMSLFISARAEHSCFHHNQYGKRTTTIITMRDYKIGDKNEENFGS